MTDPPSRLATALADRYPIERELGAIGVATVGGLGSRANEPGLGGVAVGGASLKDARPKDGFFSRARPRQGATPH